jgi:hypothetical protein
MKLLHLFVVLMFLMGIALVSTTFYTYSNIPPNCDVKSLRRKLQIAIGLGVAMTALSAGYLFCINKEGCNCTFEKLNDWAIFLLMFTLFAMGLGILILILSISSDLENCGVSLPISKNIIMGLSILQMITSIVIFTITVNKEDGVKVKDGVTVKLEKVDSYIESDKRRGIIDLTRQNNLQDAISSEQEQLSIVNSKLESGRPTAEDQYRKTELEQSIKNKQSSYESIGIGKSKVTNSDFRKNNSRWADSL